MYTWLLEREEAEARHSMPHPGNALRLAALRAGEPIDVSSRSFARLGAGRRGVSLVAAGNRDGRRGGVVLGRRRVSVAG